MHDKFLNDIFHDRIEYAEGKFKTSLEYKKLTDEWNLFEEKIDRLLETNNMDKERFQLNELPLS